MKKYLCLLFLLLPVVGGAQIITTFAGTGSTSYSGNGVPAASAGIPNPVRGTFDRYGNYYFVDMVNSQRVRKINSSGIITTIAGIGIPGFNGDGGQATAAKLNYPHAVKLDTVGNIYIADNGNYRIRKIDATTGIISTFAGNGTSGYFGDGGQASVAKITTVEDFCFDRFGNFYFGDESNYVVRKIDTSGIISTFAGSGTLGYSGDGGAATLAKINRPLSVVSDDTGNIYIADVVNNVIRKVSLTGIITPFAGNGSATYSGDGIPAVAAQIQPAELACDNLCQLFFTDGYNNRVFKIDASGILHCIAGNGTATFAGDGGAATAASLNDPVGVVVDYCGNIYIAEAHSGRIRKITYPSTPSLSITTPPAMAIGATVTINASITGGCCSNYSYLWMNHGIVFSTTTTPTVTYTKTNGIDSITAKVVGCGDTAFSIVHVVTVDKTETSLFPSKGGMTCYPNPALGELHIVSPYEMDAVTITDLLGREVYSNSGRGTKEPVINTASLPTGVYIIKAYLAGGGISVGRFMKE